MVWADAAVDAADVGAGHGGFPLAVCTATLCAGGSDGIGIQTPTCSVVVRSAREGGACATAPRGITSTGQLEWATR